MADTPVQEPQDFSRLAHLPVTFFAVLMGLFGLSFACHAAAGSFAHMQGPQGDLRAFSPTWLYSSLRDTYGHGRRQTSH